MEFFCSLKYQFLSLKPPLLYVHKKFLCLLFDYCHYWAFSLPLSATNARWDLRHVGIMWGRKYCIFQSSSLLLIDLLWSRIFFLFTSSLAVFFSRSLGTGIEEKYFIIILLLSKTVVFFFSPSLIIFFKFFSVFDVLFPVKFHQTHFDKAAKKIL